MTTETRAQQRTLHWRVLVAAVVFLVAVPPLIPRGNPYASIIEDIATTNDWSSDSVQMVNGTITDVSFLRWTRVQVVIRAEEPIYATLRKGPFSRAHVSCYSVGSPQRCDG